MVSQARQRLSDDHEVASKALKQLLTALDNKDVHTSYSKLDLLWARLAVHIRRESDLAQQLFALQRFNGSKEYEHQIPMLFVVPWANLTIAINCRQEVRDEISGA